MDRVKEKRFCGGCSPLPGTGISLSRAESWGPVPSRVPGCPVADSQSPGLGASSLLCEPGHGAELRLHPHEVGGAMPSTLGVGAQKAELLELLSRGPGAGRSIR